MVESFDHDNSSKSTRQKNYRHCSHTLAAAPKGIDIKTTNWARLNLCTKTSTFKIHKTSTIHQNLNASLSDSMAEHKMDGRTRTQDGRVIRWITLSWHKFWSWFLLSFCSELVILEFFRLNFVAMLGTTHPPYEFSILYGLILIKLSFPFPFCSSTHVVFRGYRILLVQAEWLIIKLSFPSPPFLVAGLVGWVGTDATW
jgi:hypothetical protein